MSKKQMDVRLVVAGLVTVGAFFLMLNLGFWQLERLQWKNAIIAKIDAEKQVDPKKFPLSQIIDKTDSAFRRGYLTGIWVVDKNIKIGPHMLDGKMGYWIVTPFILNDGTYVLINRGWVPETMILVMQESSPPRGIVTVYGTLRESDKEGEMVGDDPKSWRQLNIPAIAQMQGITNIAPLALFMESSEPADDESLRAAPVIASIRNEHLNYAIFWFGMAALVVVVFYLAAVQPNLPKRRSIS